MRTAAWHRRRYRSFHCCGAVVGRQPSPRIVARAIGWVPEIPLASMVKESINFTVQVAGDSNVQGAIMRLISDFEEAAFIAIVVVMAAMAVVVVASV